MDRSSRLMATSGPIVVYVCPRFDKTRLSSNLFVSSPGGRLTLHTHTQRKKRKNASCLFSFIYLSQIGRALMRRALGCRFIGQHLQHLISVLSPFSHSKMAAQNRNIVIPSTLSLNYVLGTCLVSSRSKHVIVT